MKGRCHNHHAWIFVIYLLAGFLVAGCSTLNRAMDFFQSRGSAVTKKDLKEGEVRRFVSQIRLHRGNPASHFLLANYYQQRGRHGDAIREFQKVVLIDPLHAKAHNGMGISYDWLKDFQKAVRSYQEALKIDPGLDYVHNNLGYSYLLQKDYDAAIDAFQKAIKLDDKNAKFHNNLGLAYARKGDYHLALAEFGRAGDKDKAHFNLASVYYEKGMFEKAKENYRRVLDLKPTFAGAKEGLEASEALAAIAQAAARQKEDSLRNGNIREAAVDEDSVQVDNAGIEVSNGNGVNHMARKVADYLEDRGFNVVRLTNAEHFNYAEGAIFCRQDYCGVARQIAAFIPSINHIQEVRGFDHKYVKVRILIGKDQLPYQEVYRKKVIRS